MSPDDKHYEAKVTVLSEQITHHVKEEEQRLEGMFSQARKEELICGYKAEGLPPPQTVTFIEAAV